MADTRHGTLSASTVATLTLTGNIRGLRVQHRGAIGTADIWWSWGYDTAVTPAVNATGCYNLSANNMDTLESTEVNTATTVIVKLFSTGAVPYSVETW